jgi:hypothetical protein
VRWLAAPVVALAAGLALWAPAASASCLPRDARLVLAGADAGVVGTVAERRGDEYVIRVERVVKGTVSGPDVVVRDSMSQTSAALGAAAGERLGLALDGSDGAWTTSGCDRVRPDDLVLAGESAPPCEVGGTVAQRRHDDEEHAGIRPVGRSYILGCLGRPGAPLELRAYRLSHGGGGSSLCIDFAELAFGFATGCGTNRVRGDVPARVQGAVRRGADLTVSGPATAAVRSVRIHFRRGGRAVAREAGFLRVTDPALLRRLGVARPFGQFVARIPRGARGVRLTAHGPGGRRLGGVAVPRSFDLP